MDIMSLREIMDKSVDILRKYVKTTLLFTFGYGAIGMIAAFALIIGGTIITAIAITLLDSPLILAICLSLIIILIAAFYLSLNVGIIKIAAQEFLEEKVLAHSAILASLKSMLKVLGIFICALILFIPVIAAFAGVIYLIYKGFKNSMILVQVFGTKEVLLIIASILVIIAAILVVLAYTTLFVFSLHALVIENKGVIGSLKRSYVLVKNNFWKMFGCVVLFSLATYSIRASLEGFFGLIAGIIYLIAQALNMQQDFMTFITMVSSVISWPLTLVSSLIITPIGTNMISLLYFNQRFKKEGYDIVLKLRKIQNRNERKQLSELV